MTFDIPDEREQIIMETIRKAKKTVKQARRYKLLLWFFVALFVISSTILTILYSILLPFHTF